MYSKQSLNLDVGHLLLGASSQNASKTIFVWAGMYFTGLENREYDRGDPLHWPRNILYAQMLALTLSTRGGRSVGTVFSRTKPVKRLLLLAKNTAFIKKLRKVPDGCV
jgi:hypothetical protein